LFCEVYEETLKGLNNEKFWDILIRVILLGWSLMFSSEVTTGSFESSCASPGVGFDEEIT